MNKKYIQYLHHYIGTQIIYDKNRNIENTPSPYFPFYWTNIDYVINGLYNDKFKIGLRPITDIKDDEVDKIASIILGREVNNLLVERVPLENSNDAFFLTAYWKREELSNETELEMGIHISNIGEPFRIDHVWKYIRKNGVECTREPLYNSHEITRFLLNEEFDVFGLIDNEDVLDKTITKNRNENL